MEKATGIPVRHTRWRLVVPALLFLLGVMACTDPSPSDSDLQAYLRAKELYLRGEVEQAADTLEKLTSRAGSFHQARFLLGKALFMAGRHDEAAGTFAALLEDYPRYADASLWHTRALVASGSLEEAERVLTEAMAFSSEDPRFLYAAGTLWEGRGEYQKALDYYQRAALSGNDLGEIYLSIGKVYSRFRVYEKSLRYIDKCLAVLEEGSLLYRPVVELRARIQEESEQ
jgi:tetratricopeptide (TPR) repeat protein